MGINPARTKKIFVKPGDNRLRFVISLWNTILLNSRQGPGFFHILQFKGNFSIFQIQRSDL